MLPTFVKVTLWSYDTTKIDLATSNKNIVMIQLHTEVLGQLRQKLLPLFSDLKKQFYLAGGTGFALILGHRDSIDFDFFQKNHLLHQRLLFNCKRFFINIH